MENFEVNMYILFLIAFFDRNYFNFIKFYYLK